MLRSALLVLLLALALALGSACDRKRSPGPDTPLPADPSASGAEGGGFLPRDPQQERAFAAAHNAVLERNASRLRRAIATLLDSHEEDLELQVLVAWAEWLDGAYDAAQRRAGRVRTALEPYVRAHRTDLRARVALSMAREVVGDMAGAEVQLRVAIRRGLRQPTAIAHWVELLIRRGNLADHDALISKAFGGHPMAKAPLLCAARARVFLETEQPEEARRLSDECLGLASSESPTAPRLSKLLTVRGLVDLQTGDLEGALKWFEKATSASNLNADALHDRALVLWRLRRGDSAKRLLEDAIQIRPDPEYTYLLGLIRAASGDLDRAIEALDLSIEHLDLWTAPALRRWQVPFLQGRLLSRKKSFARAQQVLEQALQLDPAPDAYRRILQYLVWVRQRGSEPRARQ